MEIDLLHCVRKDVELNFCPVQSEHLEHINQMAAGIDIGSRSDFVAVPEGCTENCVREFSSFTADLYDLADWLKSCNITTVAMESTGVYWIPLYELLDSRGFDVKLFGSASFCAKDLLQNSTLCNTWILCDISCHIQEILRAKRRAQDDVDCETCSG